MASMVRNAGIASVISPHLIEVTAPIINAPTMINAGAVAMGGIAPATGEKNIARTKSAATVTAVKPVRPPSLTPVALSMYVTTVDVPKIEPAMVAIASADSARLT